MPIVNSGAYWVSIEKKMLTNEAVMAKKVDIVRLAEDYGYNVKHVLEMEDGIPSDEEIVNQGAESFDILNLQERKAVLDDPYRVITDNLNKMGLTRKAISELGIAYFYGENSRVIRGTDNLMAVKTKTGEKGWLYNQDFYSEYDLRMSLRALDNTFAGVGQGISLEAVYDELKPRERAAVMDALKDVDWDDVWNEMYPPDEKYADYNKVFSGYDRIVKKIADVVGEFY